MSYDSDSKVPEGSADKKANRTDPVKIGEGMTERRSEPRFLCADLVMVRVGDSEQPREIVANLEDISPSGACVQMETAAREGADIEILCANCRLKGQVRYCRFSELGYDVGIAFDERKSWNKRRYTPKHLLELPAKRRPGAKSIGGETV